MTSQRHHNLTISLHWLTFVTILISLGAVFLRNIVEDEAFRSLLLNTHRNLGAAIFVLVVCRLLVRLLLNVSPAEKNIPKVERIAANAIHFILYVLLVAIPLLGWLFMSAAGKSLVIFNTFPLPALIHKNRELADQLGDIHENLAFLLMALVALHALAACWHHFVRKDNVLQAMLPSKFSNY